MNTETHFCLRVDVDTFEGLSKGIPAILDIVSKVGIPITVYLSLGKYATGRNLFRRIKQKEKLSYKLPPWKRSSFKSLIRGVILPPKSIKQKEKEYLTEIDMEELVEFHPHGYNHVKWSSKFNQFNAEETSNYVNMLKSEYRKIFGRDPTANAAPNFQTNFHYFKILENEKFKFSSDFKYDKPFLLQLEDETKDVYDCKIPQLPVTELSFDELFEKGMNTQQIKEFFEQRFKKIRDESIEYTCLYIHAVFEPLKFSELLGDVLNSTLRYDFKPTSHTKYSAKSKDFPRINVKNIDSKLIL